MPDIYLLLIGIFTLAVGPLVHQLARFAGFMLGALDGFVLVAISGLVLLHVIPESMALAGWPAILGGLVGLLVPTLIEHRLHGLARQAHMVALTVALVGIAFHAFVDGLALAESGGSAEEHGHPGLPLAVILHRLPVGLTIWLLLRPLYGMGAALATLGLIVLATVAGFFLGETAWEGGGNQVRGIFQALVAGSLLHVVVHRSHAGESRLHTGLGGVGGFVLLWMILWNDGTETTGLKEVGLMVLAGLFLLALWRRGSQLFAGGHQHHQHSKSTPEATHHLPRS